MLFEIGESMNENEVELAHLCEHDWNNLLMLLVIFLEMKNFHIDFHFKLNLKKFIYISRNNIWTNWGSLLSQFNVLSSEKFVAEWNYRRCAIIKRLKWVDEQKWLRYNIVCIYFIFLSFFLFSSADLIWHQTMVKQKQQKPSHLLMSHDEWVHRQLFTLFLCVNAWVFWVVIWKLNKIELLTHSIYLWMIYKDKAAPCSYSHQILIILC